MPAILTEQSTQAGIVLHTAEREDLPEVAFSVGDRYYSNQTGEVNTIVQITRPFWNDQPIVHTACVKDDRASLNQWFVSDVLGMIESGQWEREVFVSRMSFRSKG